MSTVYLVPDDPRFDAIGFDVTKAENHEEQTTLTTNPVESGAVVNDHAIDEPAAFSCQVFVTNTPIRKTFFADGDVSPVEATVRAYQGLGIVRGEPLRLSAFTMTRKADLVTEMHDRLTKIRKARAVLSVLTSTRQYDSMVLVNVSLPRGERSIGGGTFTLTFQQLRVVNTQTVRAPAPKEKRALLGQAVGAPNPEEKTGDAVTSKSLLKGIIDGDYNAYVRDLTATP